MRLLDKYILQNFLVPFLLCFFGFLSIWLIIDLSDNATDFINGNAGVGFVLQFYLTQLPQIVMMSLPYGLLLSLLYSLSRMSRSNEVIAMLTAGQSLGRVILPLMICGFVLTGVSTVLNYKMVPHAEMLRKQLMIEIGKKREKYAFVTAHLFRNRLEHRTWFIERMPSKTTDKARLEGINIIQQTPEGAITTKWYARDARYDAATKVWRLSKGKTVAFNAEGDITSDTPWEKLEIPNWRESPWRIASSNLQSQDLSVAELDDYLHYNADFPDVQLAPYRTHWHYRWALPWGCAIVVFLAAPLSIVYSRRGGLAGMAGAILLFVVFTLLGHMTLALGKGARISPFMAAWLPNIIFGVIGIYLLYLRSGNRELPKLFRFN